MFERSNERLACMVVLTRTHHYLLKSVHSIPNIVQYCCPTVLEETLANILNKVKPDPTSSKIMQSTFPNNSNRPNDGASKIVV